MEVCRIFCSGENAAHLGEAEVEVLSTLEDLAERESDAARFDARGGYLVDERGELMVVVAVDEYDLETGTFEVVGQFETAKTAADNDDARFFALGMLKAMLSDCVYVVEGEETDRAAINGANR